MHVLVNGWFWDQPHTGSGQYLRHLMAHLPRLNPAHDFTLLLPSQAPLHAAGQPPPHPVTLAPLPALPKALAKLFWEQATVPWMARRLAADVLFVPYWAAPFWQPVPTVVTVHDLIPLLLPAYRGGLQNRLYTGLVARTARRCAAILTVSEASKRDIVAHLAVPPARVTAVHHGPNAPTVPSGGDLAQVREKYHLPARYFLYLGGFDVRKNVTGILAAYKRYLERGGDPAVGLVLAGKLPDKDTPFFPDPRRLAGEMGVLEQVHFTGWVAEEDKPALYAGAVAFLFPSRYEGFGMMVLEAMAAGAPVITSSN